jgi:hypothetical protein
VFSRMRIKSNRISGESAHTSPTEALLIRYVSVNEHGSPVDSTRAIAIASHGQLLLVELVASMPWEW